MQTLDDLQAERLNPVKQNDAEATYAEKLNKAEAEIDWSQPADTLVRLIQAFNPWPVAFTQYDGQPLRLWRAKMGQETVSEKPPGLVISVTKDGVEVATGKGSLILEQLQPAGKKPWPPMICPSTPTHRAEAGHGTGAISHGRQQSLHRLENLPHRH